MQRQLAKELLDELPADDPRAVHSRVDLRRINTWMGHAHLLSASLSSLPVETGSPRRLLELGAGDGSLMLKVARRLGPAWNGTELILVDRQLLLEQKTQESFDSQGWRVRACRGEVLEWINNLENGAFDIILCNLFLHHFSDEQIRTLLTQVVAKARAFLCLEPHRALVPMIFSHFVGLIGCNSVTRHDAIVSVRAGF